MSLKLPFVQYINIELPKVIVMSEDKSIAVEARGSMKRLKILGIEVFDNKQRHLTGKIYKLVRKLEWRKLEWNDGLSHNELFKSKPENIIGYDPNNLDPYEYELCLTIPTNLLDKEWHGEKEYTYEYA